VYYGDIPVGAITCRIDGAGPKDKGPVTMTILTLAYVHTLSCWLADMSISGFWPHTARCILALLY
jgi:hypothetical protein